LPTWRDHGGALVRGNLGNHAIMPQKLELASNWRQAVHTWQAEHLGEHAPHPSFRRLHDLAITPLSGSGTVFIRFDPAIDPREIHRWLTGQRIGCRLHRCFLVHQFNISDYRRFSGLRFGFAEVPAAMHFRLYWYRPVPCQRTPPPLPPGRGEPRIVTGTATGLAA
jgi:hypothetical protein